MLGYQRNGLFRIMTAQGGENGGVFRQRAGFERSLARVETIEKAGVQIASQINARPCIIKIHIIGGLHHSVVKAYAEEHPDVTAAFLGVYLRAVETFKNMPAEELVAEYQRFYKTFVGKDYDAALALKDLQYHPVFSLKEQLELFDATNGPSQVRQWQSTVAGFFRGINRITAEEFKKVEDGTYVTDKYLKLIK